MVKGTVSPLTQYLRNLAVSRVRMRSRNEFTDRWKKIRNGRIIDREREGLKKVNLAWDAVIPNFLMATCGLSAVLVTGSVHVRPNGVPAFAKLQSFSARLSALAR